MGLYGRGKIFFCVADSDAYQNPQVMTQAFLCRGKLLRLGAAEAYVMVPEEVYGPGNKAGLDDAIGEGSSLENCIIQHRDPGPWDQTYTTMFANFKDFAGTRSEARNGATSLVQSIALHSDPDTGLYKASQRAQARHVGWPHPSRVGRMLRNLTDWGWLEIVDGSLNVEQSDYSHEDIYPVTPTQRLHEALRARAWRQTLGEFFAERDSERNGMANTAVMDQLAQIELVQTMHGEAMDRVRETVEEVLSRLKDPRLEERATALGLLADQVRDPN
jgi:hypothetical protein